MENLKNSNMFPLPRYYLWTCQEGYEATPCGSMNGYKSIEELKEDRYNKETMELKFWYILKGEPIEAGNGKDGVFWSR